MDRQIYNKELASLLMFLIEEFPDQRFSQILYNFGFVVDKPRHNSEVHSWLDEYNLESGALLKKVQEEIDRLVQVRK